MTARSRRLDPLAILEAAYRVELDATAWLGGIAELVYQHMGAGLGGLAFDYQVTAGGPVRPGAAVWTRDLPADAGAMLRQRLAELPPGLVRETCARCGADTASQARRGAGAGELICSRISGQITGPGDLFLVTAIDPTQHGICIGAWLGKKTQLSRQARQTWGRIARQLAAAYRLRRLLAGVSAARAGASGEDGPALTAREHQAVRHAALGHSNKLIAYEMGISPSTVGVLLHRAAHKLGTTTRDELVARFAALPGAVG